MLFVSHRTRSITRVERTDAGWIETELHAGDLVSLASPELTFSVDEIYEGITLDAS